MKKKAFCCSHSMTWPLFQKTQDPQLTRAISKNLCPPVSAQALPGHVHFLYSTGLDHIPCPIFASQSTLYSSFCHHEPIMESFLITANTDATSHFHCVEPKVILLKIIK